MSNKVNTTLLNFVGGEVSPLIDARSDLELLAKSLSLAQNFIILPQGGASYRPGTHCVGLTKLNNVGSLLPFQFNAADALVLALTEEKMRFYRDRAVVLNTAVDIVSVTLADPGVVTATAHGFSNGDEVYITSGLGMQQIGGRFYLVANKTADTFELTDQFGENVDTTGYDAYDSGATVASIYELTTPYAEENLDYIRYAQTGDIMYLVCRNSDLNQSYAPRKLVRNDFTDWTLGTFKRKNDPFVAATHTVFTVTGITQANPAVVHVTTTVGLTTGDVVQATEVQGMSELNGSFYQVVVIDATHFSLQDADGDAIDSTTYGAWTSHGKFTLRTRDPGCVAFASDGRLVYANTSQNPEGFWASRLPTTTALSRFDDFTLGNNDTYAAVYAFAPVDDKVDEIRELKQYGGNFGLLGSSSIRQIFGEQPGKPPTPSAINTVTAIQGAARVRPLVVNWDMLFVDVNRKRLRGLQYNLAYSSYAAVDYNLASTHFGLESQFKKLAWTKGQPDCIWVLRDDGVLLSVTFNNLENIAAWARHYMGASAVVLDIASIRNSDGQDELWLIVEREMGGKTYRSIEVMGQWPQFPLRRSFYTGIIEDDEAAWRNAAWEAGKNEPFLDMCLEFDGRERATADLAIEIYTPSTDLDCRLSIRAGQLVRQDVVGEYIAFALADIDSSDPGLVYAWNNLGESATAGPATGGYVYTNSTLDGQSGLAVDACNNVMYSTGFRFNVDLTTTGADELELVVNTAKLISSEPSISGAFAPPAHVRFDAYGCSADTQYQWQSIKLSADRAHLYVWTQLWVVGPLVVSQLLKINVATGAVELASADQNCASDSMTLHVDETNNRAYVAGYGAASNTIRVVTFNITDMSVVNDTTYTPGGSILSFTGQALAIDGASLVITYEKPLVGPNPIMVNIFDTATFTFTQWSAGDSTSFDGAVIAGHLDDGALVVVYLGGSLKFFNHLGVLAATYPLGITGDLGATQIVAEPNSGIIYGVSYGTGEMILWAYDIFTLTLLTEIHGIADSGSMPTICFANS
jgi:hypothetical protein